MRPAFLVTNVILLSITGAAAWLGLLYPLVLMPYYETLMAYFMVLVFAIGLLGAFFGNWREVYHIGNSLPMWGILGTGLGITNAFAVAHGAHALTPALGFQFFINAGLALTINFEAIFLMIWLRELAYRCGGEHI
jgi:hypothetical protein